MLSNSFSRKPNMDDKKERDTICVSMQAVDFNI